MSVLKLTDIHKSYKDTRALNGVGFEVPKGSVFGILGPNGSGKTTLLSIVLGVLEADRGSYSWNGKPPSARDRRQIGAFLETPNFYHYLSAYRNLEITQRISGRGSKADINAVLQKVGLYERRNSPYQAFSLGMKQRLAIGAAILGSPEIIVLDEPTNGLDPNGILEVRKLILELRDAGHTVIMASHLLDEVEKICTHVAILKTGNLLACDTVPMVLGGEQITIELRADDLAGLAAAIEGYPGAQQQHEENGLILLALPKDAADLSAINSYCFEKGITLNHLTVRKQRLESRFFELTDH